MSRSGLGKERRILLNFLLISNEEYCLSHVTIVCLLKWLGHPGKLVVHCSSFPTNEAEVVSPGLTIRFELVYHWQRHSRLTGWFSTSYNTLKLRLISTPTRSPRPRSSLFQSHPQGRATLRMFSPVNTTIGGYHLVNTPTGLRRSPQIAPWWPGISQVML